MTQLTSSQRQSPELGSPALNSPALAALAAVADVLVPGDAGYARTAATLVADGTPDLVVRPRDPHGVAAALRYAAGAGLAVTVRSGGHSMAGLSTSGDGMIIDTRGMSGVRLLDRRSGRVRVGAGATWGAVASALSPLGLGLSAGDTSQVGVGGLTLGGGIGWMVRQHGLAIDSLASAQLVTAGGRLIGADAVEHADLFWALRGGGGNFGVAVSFDFIAQPVTSVHFGTLSYRSDDVPRLIAGWRDLMRASDEKLTTTLNLMPAMPGRAASVALTCCYASPDRQASGLRERALDRWSRVAVLGSGAYVGFLGSADPADVAEAYPAGTYRRLAEVKRRYDPANVFRRTHNIAPAQA
jgi:FAD/FMN-containing dehydrogenase